jgi:hypothetical protein
MVCAKPDFQTSYWCDREVRYVLSGSFLKYGSGGASWLDRETSLQGVKETLVGANWASAIGQEQTFEIAKIVVAVQPNSRGSVAVVN